MLLASFASRHAQRLGAAGTGRQAGRALSMGRFVFPESVPEIPVAPREEGETGSTAARRLRARGSVPAVLYGVNRDGVHERKNIAAPANILSREMNKRRTALHTTLYDLRLEGGGDAERVVLRDIRMHPVLNKVYSVTFMRYNPEWRVASKGKGVRMELPVSYFNIENCPGAKRGNYLNLVSSTLPVWCTAERVPSALMIDVGGRDAGAKIRASDIAFPDGVRPVNEDDVLILLDGNSPQEFARNRAWVARRIREFEEREFYEMETDDDE